MFKRKMLLFDGSNIGFMARFSAFKNDDELPNSPHGWMEAICNRVNWYVKEFGAHGFLWLMDGPPYERASFYKPYKKQRESDTDKGRAQWKVIREAAANHFPSVQETGYEADDLIARVCQKYGNDPRWEMIICSSDKDLHQLLGVWNNVSIWRTSKGEWVRHPKYDMRVYRALTGDDSDNLPGVTGPKTAEKLVMGSKEDLDAFLEKTYKPKRADEIALEQKWIEKIPETNREVYDRNLRMMSLLGSNTLVPHCPLPSFPEEPVDLAAVFSAFLGYQWHEPAPGESPAGYPVLPAAQPAGYGQ